MYEQRPAVNPGVNRLPCEELPQRREGLIHHLGPAASRTVCSSAPTLVCITLVRGWEKAASLEPPPLHFSWNRPENSKNRGNQERKKNIVEYLLMVIFLGGHNID